MPLVSVGNSQSPQGGSKTVNFLLFSLYFDCQDGFWDLFFEGPDACWGGSRSRFGGCPQLVLGRVPAAFGGNWGGCLQSVLEVVPAALIEEGGRGLGERGGFKSVEQGKGRASETAPATCSR